MRNVLCLMKCVHLQGIRNSKSLVDAGFVCDNVRDTQIFQKCRGQLKILGARMKNQISHRGPTDIRCHCTEFSCHGSMVPGIYAPWDKVLETAAMMRT